MQYAYLWVTFFKIYFQVIDHSKTFVPYTWLRMHWSIDLHGITRYVLTSFQNMKICIKIVIQVKSTDNFTKSH